MKKRKDGNIRALLIKPNSRNKKVNRNPFICGMCSLSYNKADYKVLYANQKLVYFLLYPDWTKQEDSWFLCHDCFAKSAMKICEEYEIPVLTIKVKEDRKWFDLDFFYDDSDTPIGPEDLDLF